MMRRAFPLVTLLAVLVLSLVLLLTGAQPPAAQAYLSAKTLDLATDLRFAPDRFLIKFRSGVQLRQQAEGAWSTGTPSLNRLLADQQVQAAEHLFPMAQAGGRMDTFGLSSVYVARLKPGSSVPQAVEAFSKDSNVEWAEPDYLAYPVDTIPDDPLFAGQWGLVQIEAPAAWDLVTGTQAVAIAVVDSGLDLTHLDLSGKLWVNAGEIAGNGLDDDNNGYVDDVNGWDFVNDDSEPADDHGHGTQVAGIAAASTGDGVGIAGVCWGCRLMPVKVMQASGVANYSDIAQGVLYAAQKGAKVINLSLGGRSYSAALHTAIQAATGTYGAVVVGGAGNDNVSTPFYPAAYPEVIAVAGTDQADAKAAFSDYGPWLDVSAPAVAITTTFMGGDWGPVNGTSFATAFVSGLAGLIRSQRPGWSQALVGAQILHTADPIDALNPGYEGLLGSGRINAAPAVTVDPHPIVTVHSTALNGDPLGRPVPGQSATLQVTLGNDWLDAAGVVGTLTTDDLYVTIDQGITSFGDIPLGGTGTGSPVYAFTVAAGAGYNHSIPFSLNVTANGGAYAATLLLTVTTRSADEPVGGTIVGDTTWTNDKQYMVNSNLGIAPGVTLTIEPGTEVRFNDNYSLNVGGTLIADGTEAQPIRFMSNTGGTWGRIYFDNSGVDATMTVSGTYLSGNILHWVWVESATQGIGCNSATPYLSHVTLTGGGVDCIPGATTLWVQDSTLAGGLTVAGGGQVWRNDIESGSVSLSGQATIRENVVSSGIEVGSNSLVQNNTAGGTVNAPGASVVRNNTTSGGGISVGDSATVQENEVTGGPLSAGSSATVITNTVQGGGITVGSGSLVRSNDVEKASGWGISASGTVTLTRNRMVGCANGANIGGGQMQGNLIANSLGTGLQVSGGTIVSNTITGNTGNALVVAAGAPTMEGNNLEGNHGTYDLVNNTSNSINATNNWWGTTVGPTIDARVYDFLDDYNLGQATYTPVLTGPVQSAPAYVRGIALTPASPVGIETVAFDILFSRAMDISTDSEVTFMTANAFGWRTRASMPTARGYLGVAAARNGKVYAIGGDGGGATVEEYDPATDTWTTRASMPTARARLGVAVASNGKLYAIGGWSGGPLATVEEYDPATDTWRTRASMPTARCSLGVAAASNGRIYAIGGEIGGGSELATVEEYDPATDTWTTRASMPTRRTMLGVAAASNGRIYAIGGERIWAAVSTTVEEYDPAADTWTTRASMPTGRSGLGVAAASNGKIYAIGGIPPIGGFRATVEEYDPATDTWATRASMPTGRAGLGAAQASNGRIYAIGGQAAGGYVATTEEETPPLEFAAFYGSQWPALSQYRTFFDFSTLVPRDAYSIAVKGAVGTDGIEIAPYSGVTFTVDYAGPVGDTTPPHVPTIEVCAAVSADTLSASWSAFDPDSAITLYRYAIGTALGGTDVINWTNTPDTSFVRTGLSLIARQTYFVAVKARNEGGIWSEAGISGVVAGSGVCTTNVRPIYLPLVLRGY